MSQHSDQADPAAPADRADPVGPAGLTSPADLTDNPDRLRWNGKYSGEFAPSFTPHPLAVRALSTELPAGPVLDLACGPSGSALYAAAAGRIVTAVDVSDVALGLLADEAARRGLAGLVSIVQADLGHYQPAAESFALVLCTGFWDRQVFAAGAAGVAPGGLIGWEALTAGALRLRPGLPADWCVTGDEPASLLPPDFEVLEQCDIVGEHSAKRRLLARRPAASKSSAAARASGSSLRKSTSLT
jgi:SAM-dependent methyltransferase